MHGTGVTCAWHAHARVHDKRHYLALVEAGERAVVPLVEPVPLQKLHRLAAPSTRIGLQHVPDDLGRLDGPLQAGAVYYIHLATP